MMIKKKKGQIPVQPPNKTKVALEIIVAILLIVIFVLVMSYISNNPISGEKAPLEEENLEEVQQIEVDSNDPFVKWAGHCDSDDGDCFAWKFEQCIEDYKTDSHEDLFESRTDIVGPENGGCKTRLQFTVHPEPRVLDKVLFCIYDNSIPYNEAILNPIECYEENLESTE